MYFIVASRGSSLIYRNTKNVEMIVFTWNCFVFIIIFLCESIHLLSSFLWLHLLLSLLSLPWMGKLNIIKVPCQCSSLCWVITPPNLQALSLDLNIQMVGEPPPPPSCTWSGSKANPVCMAVVGCKPLIYFNTLSKYVKECYEQCSKIVLQRTQTHKYPQQTTGCFSCSVIHKNWKNIDWNLFSTLNTSQ